MINHLRICHLFIQFIISRDDACVASKSTESISCGARKKSKDVDHIARMVDTNFECPPFGGGENPLCLSKVSKTKETGITTGQLQHQEIQKKGGKMKKKRGGGIKDQRIRPSRGETGKVGGTWDACET